MFWIQGNRRGGLEVDDTWRVERFETGEREKREIWGLR